MHYCGCKGTTIQALSQRIFLRMPTKRTSDTGLEHLILEYAPPTIHQSYKSVDYLIAFLPLHYRIHALNQLQDITKNLIGRKME